MTSLAPTAPCPTRHILTGDNLDHWRRNRLAEARGILADATHHPDTLVVLAARVVIVMTGDSRECARAIDALRRRDPRPLHTAAAVSLSQGGAA